ncbi:non-specific lipid-transfer protein 1-like [Abrus precatorius]|uniref:Non-specific lipid-transfer protein n=1 Tax=Abrus precatorius TaxID=3816 RepID=A0A8B8KCQ5_ABRPR|nr:non-specific lipid-transfer protein 1-like [Abrus precatorius]
MMKVMNLFVPMMTLCLLPSTFSTTQIVDIICSEALPLFNPCQPYLVGSAEISASCCAGVAGIIQMADTTLVRRDLCNCIKKFVSDIGINPDNAKQLPQLCHINLPFAARFHDIFTFTDQQKA